MPITIDLRENGRVIYAVFVYPYDLADATTGSAKEKELRDKTGGIIHSLLNVAAAGRPPNQVLRAARQGPSLVHPTRGKIAVVGANLFSQTIVQLASKLARHGDTIYFFKTEDEAWAFLRKVIAEESGHA